MILLVQHGADVTNTAAVHNAVMNSVKFPPVNPGRLDIVAYLLECSASINQLELTGNKYERPSKRVILQLSLAIIVTSYNGISINRYYTKLLCLT